MTGFGAMLVLFGCIQLTIQAVSKGRERWRGRKSSDTATLRPFWRDPVFWVPPAAFWVAGLVVIAVGSTLDA